MVNSTKNVLDGLTRNPGFGSRSEFMDNLKNPAQHSPLGARNRVILEKWSPNSDPDLPPEMTQRVVQEGNIMCSLGMDLLVDLLATSALVFTATNGWVQTGAVGTGVTGPVSTDTALANSTSSVHISDAQMTLARAGARTLEYTMTIDDTDAYTLAEVGIFASSLPVNNCVARSTLVGSDQVIKGTSDTVNISHQIEFITV